MSWKGKEIKRLGIFVSETSTESIKGDILNLKNFIKIKDDPAFPDRGPVEVYFFNVGDMARVQVTSKVVKTLPIDEIKDAGYNGFYLIFYDEEVEERKMKKAAGEKIKKKETRGRRLSKVYRKYKIKYSDEEGPYSVEWDGSNYGN